MLQRKKIIGIFTVKRNDVKPWDPDTIHSGITGSEEAVIYISKELAQLGYEVIVFSDPPQKSIHTSFKANPRFVDVNFSDFPRLDIAISWRMYSSAQELKKIANQVYLWPHDICSIRISQQEIQALDGVLWLSEWQKNNWTSINPDLKKFKTVFGNAIIPEQFDPIQERKKPFSCIYGSNYARGLDFLLDIWPEVKKHFPEASLDIYYGWNQFGLLSDEQNRKIKTKLEQLTFLDVLEHGMVGHEELNKAYSRASFWTYPCTNVETFCITALRAQFAGAIPVIIRGSALSETVRFGYSCLHKDYYLFTLIRAMQCVKQLDAKERNKMRGFIEKEYTWKIVANKWKKLFEENKSKICTS